MSKKLFFVLFILFLLLFFWFSFSSISFAADPKLVSTLKKAFEKIEGWLVTLAMPAAAVAVCTGLFMKKFSFGDEERIRMGKKIVRGSLFSYGFVLAVDLVLKVVESLIKG